MHREDGDSGSATVAEVACRSQRRLRGVRRAGKSAALAVASVLSLIGAPAAWASFEPQVVVDGAGDATFVWISQAGEVQTRGWSEGGSPTPIRTLSAGPVERAPQLATNAAGDVTFAWISTGDRLRTRTLTAAGALSDAQTVSGSTHVARRQQVALDPSGNATFVWERLDGGAYRVHARVRMADGTMAPPQSVSPENAEHPDPQVAVDDAGQATIVWEQFYPQGKRAIAERVGSAAGVLSPRVEIGRGTQLYPAEPQVAVGSSGDASIAWINGQGRPRVRAPLVGSEDLRSARGTTGPRVAVDASGLTTVVADGPRGINAFDCSVTTNCITQRLVTSTNSHDPALAVSAAENHATFVWLLSEPGQPPVIQTVRRIGPSTYTGRGDLSASTGTPRRAPQVAAAPDDNAFIVWEETSSVQARARAANGTLSPIEDLTQP